MFLRISCGSGCVPRENLWATLIQTWNKSSRSERQVAERLRIPTFICSLRLSHFVYITLFRIYIFRMEDIKRASGNLLFVSAIVAIFALAYILSRINPETRRMRILQRQPAASSAKTSPSTNAVRAAEERSEHDLGAADLQFCEAMRCTNADDVVKLGRT